jgi:hypothetical protein
LQRRFVIDAVRAKYFNLGAIFAQIANNSLVLAAGIIEQDDTIFRSQAQYSPQVIQFGTDEGSATILNLLHRQEKTGHRLLPLEK